MSVRAPSGATTRRRLVLALGLGLGSLPVAARPPRVEVPVAFGENSARGFVLPLLKLIGAAAGIEWLPQTAPWARVLTLAERGQALAFGMSRNPQREQAYEFSDPVFDNHAWLVVRRDRPLAYKSLADLQGRRVCITRGISYGEAFDAAKGRLFQVEPVDADLTGRVRMLVAERCDVMLTSHRSPNPWLIERRLRESSGHSAAIAVLPVPMTVEPVHFAVARGQALAAVLPRINEALRLQRPAIRALVDSDV